MCALVIFCRGSDPSRGSTCTRRFFSYDSHVVRARSAVARRSNQRAAYSARVIFDGIDSRPASWSDSSARSAFCASAFVR